MAGERRPRVTAPTPRILACTNVMFIMNKTARSLSSAGEKREELTTEGTEAAEIGDELAGQVLVRIATAHPPVLQKESVSC